MMRAVCIFIAATAPLLIHALETPLRVGPSGAPLLLQVTNSHIGITWTNSYPAAQYIRRQNIMNGAGVALGDFDSDGRCDIFLCGKFAPAALYRNLGDWRFEDVTARAGVGCSNQVSTGAVFADYDGDGRLDLFVSSFFGPNACFRNLGDGSFRDVTEEVGLKSTGGATSMALGDLDGDGDLDLYVAYFGVEALLRDGVSFNTRMVGGRTVVTGRYSRRLAISDGRITEFGEPDILYRNDRGKFTPLKWEEFFVDEHGKPMAPPFDFGLAVQIRDIDLDGDPDIYTCNDFHTPDRVWLNDGQGRFRAIAPLALRNHSYASMGVDFADIDRDGDLDFVTVEMLSRESERGLRQISPMSPVTRAIGEFARREDVARNGLYLNRGDGTYTELAWFSGIAATDWSWTPIFVDIDLDGYEDLLVSNGHLHDVNDRDWGLRTSALDQETKRRMLSESPRLDPPKAAYRNRGNLTFEDVSEAWGFNSRSIIHGMALADLDGDGDQDIVGSAVNSGPVIYKNNSEKPRVAVRLRGKAPNTKGIGTRVVLRGRGMEQIQEILAGGRYLSADDTTRVFAVPGSGGPLALEVTWRNGRRSLVEGLKQNSIYEMDEAESEPSSALAPPQQGPPLFEDASRHLEHLHHEEAFNDFERQPLLPRRYSQSGPGIAWFDLDGDGKDELIAGSGRGGAVKVMRKSGSSDDFKPQVLGRTALPDDSAGLAGTFINGERVVLAALSHYESGRATGSVELLAVSPMPSLPALENNSSAGAIAVADIDGDGDLDLFVGGRVVPGNYPAPASSALYRLNGSEFVRDEAGSKLIRPDGLITAAVFSDLDADGFAELITAEEWGSVRVYKNDRGQITKRLELEWPRGFWNSVTTGDLNGDGQLDIVAGNIGRNNSIVRGATNGHWLVYYDFEPAVNGELIEAYGREKLIPMRDLQTLSSAIPSVATLFPSHEAFAQADMRKALNQYWARGKSLQANQGDSLVFWNDGAKGWHAEPLPGEAQWAPAFGLNVADFDNDAREDLFLSQNFFAGRPGEERADAGRGLLLKGTKTGLEPVSADAAGIRIYGEQRGSAVSDFDGDGRLDLAAAQNGGETKLYRNVSAPPGLRVRLKGPTGNPLGYGAILRPKWASEFGPAREIHCGSGYWSQDSAVQVFAPNVKEISVLWPGGQRTVSKVPDHATEIEIDTEGRCSIVK